MNITNNFDFEIEKTLLVENLNFLKTLSVREYTLYKKWEELRHYDPPQPEIVQHAKELIWRPDGAYLAANSDSETKTTIARLNAIRPKVIVVGEKKADSANFRLWETYRYFISSAEHNNVPARIMKFLVVDDADTNKRVLGIASVASDVNAIACRDKYIGWTTVQKSAGKLNHTAIAATVVPTQPFGGNLLGGKLIAALLTTRIVRDEWKSRYGDVLAGMTTTSLYGSPCMYDGIPYWRHLGYAAGSIPVVPDKELYSYWRRWVAQNRSKDFKRITTTKADNAGPATSEKLRVLNLIFNTVGISLSSCKHGFRRGVYFSPFYMNTKEFLCGLIPETELVLKPSLQDDVEGVLNWWRPRAIQRYLNLSRSNKLAEHVQWYAEMKALDYATAKAQYLSFIAP